MELNLQKSKPVMRALVATIENPRKKQRIVRSVSVLSEAGFAVDYLLTDKTISELSNDNTLSGAYFFSLRESKFRSISDRAKRHLLSSLLLGLPPGFKHYREILLASCTPASDSIISEIVSCGTSSYSLILVEEYQLLPLALEIQNHLNRRARIVVELRDYYWHDQTSWRLSEPLRKKIKWWFFKKKASMIRRKVYKTCLPQADQVFTVSNALARQIESTTGTHASVIRSLPRYSEGPSSSPTTPMPLCYVYHGLALRKRKLERVLKAIDSVAADVRLTCYLVAGDEEYIEELKAQASGRIEIKDPVPYENLIEETSQFDVGLAYFSDLDSTMRGALPNKFFEYFQSRIPVLASPSEDMASILQEYQVGWVTDDWSFDSLVRLLESITPEMVAEAKKNCERAAKTFCFEVNRAELESVLLGDEGRGRDHPLSPVGQEAIE